MDEKEKGYIPYKADVCIQPIKGNMQNMEFSNTLCILTQSSHIDTIKTCLDSVEDMTYTVKHESPAFVLISVRVSKLINFSAVITNIVTQMKTHNLVVVKS